MKQGDLIRVLASFAFAGAGAGLALAGAAVTGNLGSRTTIEQFTEAAAPAAAASAASTAGSGLSIEQIYRLDAPGVVQITATSTGKQGSATGSRTLGSGFVIDKAGHIVTNNHVIAGAGPIEVSFSGNDEMTARVVGADPATDVAVLQVDAHSRSLTPLPLGDSDDVQVGDAVVAIGNPFSITRTATAGIVSAVERTIDAPEGSSTFEHAIQTDAAINHGNAGGPLINSRGEVIGVNAELVDGATSQGTVGVGFAIPIDTVKTVVAQLIQSGKVEHAYLGITAVPVTSSLARIFDLPTTHGLLIQNVTPGSAAARAGLKTGTSPSVVAGESYRVGDIIVAAGGAPISNQDQLRDVIETMQPGDRLVLTIWRDGAKRTVRVTLGQPPG